MTLKEFGDTIQSFTTYVKWLEQDFIFTHAYSKHLRQSSNFVQ